MNQRFSKYTEDAVPFTSSSRTEEIKKQREKRKRREEWRRQQELAIEHERLKKQKIMEWERKRQKELGKRSSSYSPLRHRTGRSSLSQYLTTSKEISNEKFWFSTSEGQAISFEELRRIKVTIRRNIPVIGPIYEIQRDIHTPDDVVILRRNGEGSKPIFDRAEIKLLRAIKRENKKHRTDSETNKMQTSRKRSLSPSSSNRYDRREKSYKYSRKSKDTERDRDRNRKQREEQRSNKNEADSFQPYIWTICSCKKISSSSRTNQITIS
ncbi:apoptotic chromatin condensation inducer in the nucleus-like isoform X2 [Pseudomyrmex gracilis]|uniref:apoptotic chromatin condensation inducer in the nucleus-like isoform X2 n=1 Tax=Pseudomyrmex gracilis TaxID=219809 RepID=UPI000994C269|nr:apoptotic chromatin condensation inducer in the nucleus-like isoform X2 [Pseudomyrmex gracilis]